MSEIIDQPLHLHPSLNNLLEVFLNTSISTLWLKTSVKIAKQSFQKYPYVVVFDSSVIKKQIKVDDRILTLIEEESTQNLLFTKTQGSICQIITITAKDILWEEKDFQHLQNTEELKFLRYIRNASAHNNTFYFGKGKEREKTLRHLPISWRGKTIDAMTEGKRLFFDFINAADLMILLSDISRLVEKDTAGS